MRCVVISIKITIHCNFTLEAVRQNEGAYKYASKEIKCDKEVLLAAVERGAYILGYEAPREMRFNKEVVLAAVKKNGFAIEYAPCNFRNDIDIVLAAIKQNYDVLETMPHWSRVNRVRYRTYFKMINTPNIVRTLLCKYPNIRLDKLARCRALPDLSPAILDLLYVLI